MAIDDIYQIGDDALGYQFDVVIPTFPGALDVQQNIIRVTQFPIPNTAVGTYEIARKGLKITKPSGVDESEKQFTITFRVDKYYKTYKGIRNWMKVIKDKVTGAASPDYANGQSPIRVPISVYTVDANGDKTGSQWDFDGCYPTSLDGVSLDYTNGDPVEVNVTFDFLKVVES